MSRSNHIVIMAGGIGSRFWPISTAQRPKQFIDVLGCGKTLLQLTVERFGDICPIENVWVVTSVNYADIVREQLPQIPEDNILLEPCRRNTAPCIAYAAWKIKKKDPHANMVVTPSDHFVADCAEFRRVIKSALKFAAESDAIMTLGIKPTRPETGYGYIEAVLGAATLSNKEVFRVDSFKEKPDLDTAKQYISKNNFYWNAGIFIWSVQTIVNAFRVYQSPIASVFESMMPYYFTVRPKFKVGDYFIEHWDKETNIYQYQGNKHFKCLNKKQGYHCDYIILGALLLEEYFIKQISKEEAEAKLKELRGE